MLTKQQRYAKTPKGMEAARRKMAYPLGVERYRRYLQSPRGQESRWKNRQRAEFKAAKLEYQRRYRAELRAMYGTANKNRKYP